MKKIILFGLMFVSFLGYSQEEIKITEQLPKPVEILDSEEIVSTKAEYPGGIQEFYKYIAQNYVVPEEASENGINGNVLVAFTVDTDGSLTDIKVLRDLGYGTDIEAIRVIKKSKKWKPAIQNGEAVRMKFTQPIRVVTE